ncbi:MAG: hypothetical protein QXN26_02640 [Thermoplasmataceae archaeon]
MKIRCISVRNHVLEGIPQGQQLETLEGDQIFLCDYDGILHGNYNFKIYTRVAKFFDTVVFNMVQREYDLVDSLVSGAARVVVDPDMKDSVLQKVLDISPDTVFPYSNQEKVERFRAYGGTAFLATGEINGPFSICYNAGIAMSSEKYVDLDNFPEDLLRFI